MNDTTGNEKVIDLDYARKKFQSQKSPRTPWQKALQISERYLAKNTGLVHKAQLFLFLGFAAYILQLCERS